MPQGHAAGRIEELGAPGLGDSEDRPGLREEVRAREAPLENHGTATAQHTVAVPPLGEVHLTVAGYNETELEKAVEVDARLSDFSCALVSNA